MKKRTTYNLNKMKGSRIIILILALSFIVVPLVTLLVNFIALAQNGLF